MNKNTDEIAADILNAALANGQVKTSGSGANFQAGEIASAFKIIREAVASAIPPGP
jgi:hypothetical protein